MRVRPSKKRLPGSEISVPSNPPIKAVQAEINMMIISGRFTLGEECAPYKLTRYVPNDGRIVTKDVLIHGRKVPLEDLRNRLLKKHERYMRLNPNEKFDAMTRSEILESLQTLGKTPNEPSSDQELRMLLRSYERGRSLALWHDHATILGNGFILVTVHTVYDAAVFLTNAEYKQLHGGIEIDVQAEVEQPEIYLLSLGSSSVADQAALIGDRLDCMIRLSSPVVSSNGLEIYDTTRFFTGDHPAAQFEQGTQQGGRYKCGACGCKDTMFTDQAHSLRCHWRSLQELQELAVGGVYGSKPGATKPLEKLRIGELREELKARGVFDLDRLKPESQTELQEILKGVQRVPALLLVNPKQELRSLNINRYEVMACEPLHDLKGHLHNLLDELPNILQPSVATKCEALLGSCLSKDKISGADLRRTVIQVFLYFLDCNVQPEILSLLQSIIKVGEILYSSDSRRTPRALLQLYNHCWFHFELCTDLFSTPKSISHAKMFGHYLHALTAHAPTQYELVCLRSVNTENQERLFGQARQIALKCTNRSPQNVIPQVLLHLQAKQEHIQVLQTVHTAETQVSHFARHLPPAPRSTFSASFIQRKRSSWQAHLEQISHFLTQGEGVWWRHVKEGYQFFDGDSDSSVHPTGPTLQHYRHSSIGDIERIRKACWNCISTERIPIPTDSIKVYNGTGDMTGQLVCTTTNVVYVPFQSQQLIAPNGSHTSPTGITDHHQEHMLHALSDGIPAETDHADVNMPCPQSGKSQPKSPVQERECREPPLGPHEHPLEQTSVNPPPLQDQQQLTCSEQPGPSGMTSDSTTPENVGEEETIIEIPTLESHNTLEALKTTLASSMSRVLGRTRDVLAFDELRYELKQAKKSKTALTNFKQLLDKHDNYLAKLTSLILKAETLTKEQIRQYENDFFFSHAKLPSTEKNSDYAQLISSRNHARTILRSLKVQF